MKSDGGFTLLELVVTVLIAGILMAVGLPSMTSIVRNNRLAGVSNDFTSALSTARMEAMKRGLPVIVCRSNTPEAPVAGTACGGGTGFEAGWYVFVDTNNDGTMQSTETVLLVHAAVSDKIFVRGQSNTVNSVRYNAQGIVGTAGTGSIVIQDENGRNGTDAGKYVKGTRLICIGATGRSQLLRDATLPIASPLTAAPACP